jgi:predicted metal-binding membrane protein
MGAPATLTGWLGRRSPLIAVVLGVAALAWALTASLALGGMGAPGMPATMGLSLAPFLGVWVLMMAAMMLPAVAPVAALYLRALRPSRSGRVAGFLGGYLLVWAAAGVPAYLLARGASRLAASQPRTAQVLAVATFAAVAVYQVSPLKRVCLRSCRSPLGQFLRYAQFTGPLRDLRVGVHHGLYCLGCCWALFVALMAVGLMNLVAMAALTGLVALEKLWTHGVAVSRLVAVGALAVAVLLAVRPELAQALWTGSMTPEMSTDMPAG